MAQGGGAPEVRLPPAEGLAAPALDPALVVQGLLSGLLFGGVYSLMAVGLTLIFGVMRVVNFAHGDMMVWGMYLAWLASTRPGVDPYLGFLGCAAALFALGLVTQRVLVDRIIDAPHEMQILLMLGVALVLENAALVAFGPDPVRVRSPLTAVTVWLGPIFVDVARLVTFGVAIVLTLALYLFLKRTDLGRTMRAAADNSYGALVIGTDVRRVYAVAFGIGAACVGAAGALVSPILPFSPSGGLSPPSPRSISSSSAGWGACPAPSWAGCWSPSRSRLARCSSRPSLKELVSFSLLIVILLLRPAGLFGKSAA